MYTGFRGGQSLEFIISFHSLGHLLPHLDWIGMDDLISELTYDCMLAGAGDIRMRFELLKE